MIQGTIKFSENEAKFCIVDEEKMQFLDFLDFGDEFEVNVDGKWIPTKLEIINNEAGELIFSLKGTPFNGNLDGIEIRKQKC